VKGGGNMGRDYYRRLNAELDARGAPRVPEHPTEPRVRIGKLARALGISARKARRIHLAGRRAMRRANA
jgi:hypothetical protein